METLKRTSVVILLLILPIIGIKAQNNYKAIQDAFQNSYTHEYKGEYTKAIEVLKAVYDEKSYEINLRLGWVTYLSGLFAESTAYYKKAITLRPFSIEAKLGYVYPASALGNWEQVKAQYIDILKIDTKHYIANYRMGLIYYGKEDYNMAFKHFETVVNLYPFDYDAVIMYAWTNFKLGKLREAKVLFNKALMIRPADASATEGLSYIK
jgi:tetratricopeptide (TPR) repeat protein